MRNFFSIVLVVLLIRIDAVASDTAAIRALIKRMLPESASQFRVEYISRADGRDWYEIAAAGGNIILRGNNNVSLAAALNDYLANDLHARPSWVAREGKLLQFRAINTPRNAVAPSQYRSYLNYCTFSYSMAFWGWSEWEKEIDWMAMHGINLPLAIAGQEAVWQHTLARFGYSDAEIKVFISGPSFIAWWLMGNLEGWGGPVTQHWIDSQKLLQQKILARMRSLDMHPVLQGFYGMVPNSLAVKFPNAAIHDPGGWLGFKRPGMLLPTDGLYRKMASAYYAVQTELYGKADFFQGDPFHEGGNIAGLDLRAAGRGIYQAMQENQPGAVWVLQNWQENPRNALLQDVPKGKALVINIMAEAKPQWGGKTKFWPERSEGFAGHDWIWSEIPNFGGRTGMAGKLDSTVEDIADARRHAIGKKTLKGLGMAPEGIGQDEVLYDLLYETAWTEKKIDLDQWLPKYIQSRYGSVDDNLLYAWQLLRQTVYNAHYGRKDPPLESIFCARPGWNKTSASTWGMGDPDYDPLLLVKAWKALLRAPQNVRKSETYRFDLVNVTRQVLANYGRTLYRKLQLAFEKKDITGFEKISAAFIQLINDQDRLLSSRSEFLLGLWLAMARKKGSTVQESNWLEWNARTLVATWTHELNDVNDYSCREWSGLLKNYYVARWKMFIDFSLSQLKGGQIKHPDFFGFESGFTHSLTRYPDKPQRDELAVTGEMAVKYAGVLAPPDMTALDPRVKIEGRIGRTADRLELYWAGSTVAARFAGSGINAVLSDETGNDFFYVIVDGKVAGKIRPDKAKSSYSLATGLTDTVHTVSIFKCTQWDKGTIYVHEFELSPGGTFLEQADDKRPAIEFYGDSITSGSAVEDSAGHDNGDSRYENNYLSYAALTARHFNASYTCIARSGIGLVKSWFPLVMPQLFDRLNPNDSLSRWDFSLNTPQIVVVNILQNDSWLIKENADSLIIDRYALFITMLRLKYPYADVLCALGNMDATAPGAKWPDFIKAAVRRLNDQKVFTVFFPYKQTPGHPNAAEQERMADQLIAFIDKNRLWQTMN